MNTEANKNTTQINDTLKTEYVSLLTNALTAVRNVQDFLVSHDTDPVQLNAANQTMSISRSIQSILSGLQQRQPRNPSETGKHHRVYGNTRSSDGVRQSDGDRQSPRNDYQSSRNDYQPKRRYGHFNSKEREDHFKERNGYFNKEKDSYFNKERYGHFVPKEKDGHFNKEKDGHFVPKEKDSHFNKEKDNHNINEGTKNKTSDDVSKN